MNGDSRWPRPFSTGDKNVNKEGAMVLVYGLLLFVVVLNIVIPLAIRRYIVCRFAKRHTIKESLIILRVLHQYVHNSIIVISSFVLAMLLFIFVLRYSPKDQHEFIEHVFKGITGQLVIYIILIPLLVYNQYIYYKTYRVMRQMEATAKQYIWRLFQYLLVFCLIGLLVRKLVWSIGIINTLAQDKLLHYVVVGFLIIGLNALFPFIFFIVFKAKPIEDVSLKQNLLAMIEEHKIKKVKIYSYSGTKYRSGHAWVCGLFVKNLFITDYLIEKLTLEELKGLLAHEVAHVKKFHIWVNTALMFIRYVCFISLLEWLEKSPLMNDSLAVLGVFLLCIVTFFYFSRLLSRTQEHQADRYAVETGTPHDVYISMLNKLAQLNDMKKETNKWVEKFQTHPSFKHRIEHIQKHAVYGVQKKHNKTM